MVWYEKGEFDQFRTKFFRYGEFAGVTEVIIAGVGKHQHPDYDRLYSSGFYEHHIKDWFTKVLIPNLNKIDLVFPLDILVTFKDIKGLRLPFHLVSNNLQYILHSANPIEKNCIKCDPICIGSHATGEVLRPAFDRLWNAFGQSKSLHFNR